MLLKSRIRTRTFLLIVLLGGVAGAQTAGYVLSEKGDAWVLRDQSRLLHPGDPIPADGELRNFRPRDGDEIVVAGLDAEIAKKIQCLGGECKQCRLNSGTCYDPISPLRLVTSSQPSAVGLAIEAARQLLFGNPDRFSAHRSRGLSRDLSDSVVLLSRDGCDLQSVFSQQIKGLYRFRIQELAASPSGKTWDSGDLSLDWDPEKPASRVSIAGLHAGLYRVYLLQQKGTGYGPSSTDAWILLTNADDYGRLGSLFHDVSTKVAPWEDLASPETVEAYLRAFLASEAVRR
jgi:hypothetical protein